MTTAINKIKNNVSLTGNMKFLRKVESPWKSHYFIEKYERSHWHKALIDRKIADFCAGLQIPTEPWYRMTSTFSKKNCPYEAGHVEKFEMVSVAGASKSSNFALIGKYRVTLLSFFVDEDGRQVTDCMRIGFELSDS